MAEQQFSTSNEGEVIQGLEGILAAGEAEDAPEEAQDQQVTVKATPEPTPEDAGEAEEAASEPEESAKDAAEAEDEKPSKADTTEDESDEVEMPDTWAGFAEKHQVDPDELAAHVRVPVKIDGRSSDVPLSDVIASYQQSGHWEQKNMALADERRSHETERQAFTTERQQTSQILHALAQHAEKLIAGEEEAIPAQLREDDPVEYQSRKEALRDRRDSLQQLYGGVNQVIQQTQAQQTHAQDALMQYHAQALAEKIPEWGADPVRAQRGINELRVRARQEFGYSQEETEGLIDHRTILAFKELFEYRDQKKATVPLARKKLKAVLPKTKTTKPGAGLDAATTKSEAAKRSMARLRNSGDYRDGEDVLMKLGIV